MPRDPPHVHRQPETSSGSPGRRWKGGPEGLEGRAQDPTERLTLREKENGAPQSPSSRNRSPQLYVSANFSHADTPVGRSSGGEQATSGEKSLSTSLGGYSVIRMRRLIFSPENPGPVS